MVVVGIVKLQLINLQQALPHLLLVVVVVEVVETNRYSVLNAGQSFPLRTWINFVLSVEQRVDAHTFASII
jgi:hypothetical protein